MKEVVITHGVRTPIGKIGKAYRDVPETTLGKIVLQEVLNRSKIDTQEIDHVIMGQVYQHTDPSNIARVVSLESGLPETIPCYTVMRQCASGLQAIMNATNLIQCDEADVVLAGGAENMSRGVYVMRNTSHGFGNGKFTIEDYVTAGGAGATPESVYGLHTMGMTAEKLATVYNISREQQDQFAQASQEKADRAIREGRFKEQIVPVTLPDGRVVDTDEHPFLTSVEKLGQLRPAFIKTGSVTAGNASGRNDAASMNLVMSKEKADSLGYKPMARVISHASSGCDPTVMGLGPVECTRVALKKAGLTLNDIDVIELNEAFASQSLAVITEWLKWGDVSEEALYEKLNPNGGAIALGHPLGSTGSLLTVKCMYELLRVPSHRYGLITMCCAGGLGVAMVIEKYEQQ